MVECLSLTHYIAQYWLQDDHDHTGLETLQGRESLLWSADTRSHLTPHTLLLLLLLLLLLRPRHLDLVWS